ncbi:unnamed protein product [Ambrosiozyma monospora]|uniref:Unnamed protein product n=1 Tax=Ambrosiozyma monospora TaxID=43982 RepID=A0A9W6YUQ5_AMBMO|nr:unnamed protein product [Ambrosiozyma monospora]
MISKRRICSGDVTEVVNYQVINFIHNMSLLPNWGFRNTVHATHSIDTIKLPLKQKNRVESNRTNKNGNNDNSKQIQLTELINQRIPQIRNNSEHCLSPLLFTGVLQNFYVAQANYCHSFPVLFGRKLYHIAPDDAKLDSDRYKNLHVGQFSVDFAIGLGNKKYRNIDVDGTKAQFIKRAKETLPDDYPEVHHCCRYFNDDEMNRLFNHWSNSEGIDDDRGIVVIVPGLAGGVNEPQNTNYHAILDFCFRHR